MSHVFLNYSIVCLKIWASCYIITHHAPSPDFYIDGMFMTSIFAVALQFWFSFISGIEINICTFDDKPCALKLADKSQDIGDHLRTSGPSGLGPKWDHTTGRGMYLWKEKRFIILLELKYKIREQIKRRLH